jgi:ribosomal protein L37AE/L43A
MNTMKPKDDTNGSQRVNKIAANSEEQAECPDCGSEIRAKTLAEGGGIACTAKECGYWFCY